MHRPSTVLVALALTLGGAAVLALPGAAQQPPAGLATQGRYEPAPLGADARTTCVLDTWTGRVHIAPRGVEPAEGVKAWVYDLPEACAWERPLARDVSAGHVLPHSMPLPGLGAGASVFTWQPDGGAVGILDTRNGAHYSLSGQPGGPCKVIRTDLRMLTRSTRDVRGAE